MDPRDSFFVHGTSSTYESWHATPDRRRACSANQERSCLRQSLCTAQPECPVKGAPNRSACSPLGCLPPGSFAGITEESGAVHALEPAEPSSAMDTGLVNMCHICTLHLCSNRCADLDPPCREEQQRDGHQGEHHCDEQHAWHRQVQAAGGLLRPSWRRLLPCKHARRRQWTCLLTRHLCSHGGVSCRARWDWSKVLPSLLSTFFHYPLPLFYHNCTSRWQQQHTIARLASSQIARCKTHHAVCDGCSRSPKPSAPDVDTAVMHHRSAWGRECRRTLQWRCGLRPIQQPVQQLRLQIALAQRLLSHAHRQRHRAGRHVCRSGMHGHILALLRWPCWCRLCMGTRPVQSLIC